MIWKPEEVGFISDNFQSKNYLDIAKKLGRSERAVGHKISRLGLSKDKRKFIVTKQHKKKKQCKEYLPCYRIIITGRNNFIKFRDKIGFSIKRKAERLEMLPKLHSDKEWRKRLSDDAKSRPRDERGMYIKRV